MPINRTRLLATSAALLVAGLVHAGPTGLFLMPIADILRHREANVGVGLLGYEHNVSKGYDYGNSTTVGAFDRIEFGYDNDFKGTTTGNVKLLLFEHDHAALSVGVAGWRGDSADPYVVARYDGKGYRLHGGLWRTGDACRAMLGTDFPAGPGLTGTLEYLSGHDGQAWASLAYAVPFFPGLSVQAAVGGSTDRSLGIQHSLNVSYAFNI